MHAKILKTRDSDGITVALCWNADSKNDPREPALVVDVSARGLPSFTATADTLDDALEIYAHPYASLNRLLKSGRVAA
jgi:hypothetical protein